MGIGKVVAGWTTVQLARFLATRVATPVILTGTVALAGAGAMVSPISLHQTPTYPNSTCRTGWNGDAICRIPASQVAAYPTPDCHPSRWNPATQICFIRSAAYPNAFCRVSWRYPGTDICRFKDNASQ
jgi:hypothetical protein